MKILRLIPVLLLGAMLTACNTTKKLFEAHEYDQVIQRLAPKICDGDKNAEHIDMLAASYHNANQADHERIQTLKNTGQPDVWPEIYQRFCNMRGRDDAVKCFPDEILDGKNLIKVAYENEMVAARNKAENYLVAKTNQLLGTNTKEDALEAKSCIEQLSNINKANSNLPLLWKRCQLRVADRLLVTVDNRTEIPLSRGFIDAVLRFDNGETLANVEGASGRPRLKKNDVEARIVVNDVQATPDRHDEVTFQETNAGKTVEVTDHTQNKVVVLMGTVQYFNAESEQAFATVPFEVKSAFRNSYTTIKGDREVCSAETLSRLDSRPLPFPTDESMLVDAAKRLNDIVANELKK